MSNQQNENKDTSLGNQASQEIQNTEVNLTPADKESASSNSSTKQSVLKNGNKSPSETPRKSLFRKSKKNPNQKINNSGVVQTTGPQVKQKQAPILALYGLFKYAGPLDILLLVVATAGACAQGVALPALFLVFGGTIDTFAQSAQCAGLRQLAGNPNAIGSAVLPFVYIGIGTIFTGYAVAGLTGIMGTRIARIWRLKYLEALMYQDVEFFDVESTPGTLLASLNEDTLNIEQALGQKYGSFFQFCCMFIVGIIIAIAKAWQIGLVMFAAVPSLIISLGGFIMIQARLQIRRNKLYEVADDVVQQYLTQIRTVASYNAMGTVIKQFKDAVIKPTKLGYIQGVYEGLGIGIIYLSLFGTNALGWWFGADRLRQGKIQSAGDVLIAIFSIIIGGFSLAQIAPSLIYFNRGVAAKLRMEQTIAHKPRIDSRKPGVEPPPNLQGDVELQDVSFAYPARPDFLVFKDFSLKINHGTTVALVGQSGSGKSTIVQLVQRFYDPTYGKVIIDGIDLRDYQLLAIRQHIGLVNQEPILFSGTIEQNILQGKLGASQEEMIEAAKNANVHEFIDSLPDKYRTSVGARGVSLSGGQKQRVAIARAMLKNPKIMLLDEATSALDNKSERVVQEALNKLAVGRTTIVVAHRLSTIRNSNEIAVIREGQMVELGSHDELIQKADGFYTNLVKIQMAAGDLDIKQDPEQQPKDEDAALQAELDQMQQETQNKQDEQEKSLAQRVSASIRRFKAIQEPIAQASVRNIGVPDFNATNRSILSSQLQAESQKHIDIFEKEPQPKKKGLQGLFQKKEKKPKGPSSFRRMLKMQLPEWQFIVLGVLASILVGGQQPGQAVLVPRALYALIYLRGGYVCQSDEEACPCEGLAAIQQGQATNQEIANQSFARYTWLDLVVVYCYVAMAGGFFFIGLLQKASFTYMGTKLAERMRELLLYKIMCQEIGFFDYPQNSVGSLASRLQTDALVIRGAVGDSIGVVFQELATVIGCLVVAFVAGGSAWKLSLVVIATLPLFAAAIFMQQRFNFGFAQSSGDDYALANNIATESAFNIRIVHSFTLEKDVTERYSTSLNRPYKRYVKQSNITGWINGASNFIQFGVNALGLWYGGVLLSRGELNVLQLFQSFFGVTFIGQGMANAQIQFPDVAKSGPAAKRIYEIVDREPQIDNESDNGEKLQSINGLIEYKHIKFVYPTREEVVVFQDFSLRCEAGQTTAMVGESGSGKSTVVSLLERFYDPQKGAVYLDGVNIQKLNLRWLRDSIAMVAQEPVLFNATLMENIQIGRPDTTEEEAMEACRIANIAEFVENLPQKLETAIGERGIRLSGGQKQRIAIARAVVKNTRILLLDEATSALDANSEHVVQEALDRISKNRTTITIAHRLSTIRHANKIAVVQKGKLVEQGTHEELVKIPDGVYNGLVKAQEKQK